MKVLLVISASLALAFPAGAETRLTAIEKARRAVHACQDDLRMKHSPVSRGEPKGQAYRRWVLKLWKERRRAYCGALRQVRRLFSFDEAVSAKAWASSWAAECVSSHEGAVTSNTGNGYYGKWQADTSFQLAYGAEFYERWGVASNWPEWAQDVMAHRGYQARGWEPWPTTSVICGVR